MAEKDKNTLFQETESKRNRDFLTPSALVCEHALVISQVLTQRQGQGHTPTAS